MPRDDAARVADIIDAARRIAKHIGDRDRATFVEDDTAVRAVLFDIAVIGEAAKGVSEVTRSAFPTVPWADMAGMRDVVIHQYFGIDVSLVWTVATTSVVRLLTDLESGA
jgi:uncharacterized protein with HEPN domain